MRKVRIQGIPPADWAAEADAITSALRAAPDGPSRKLIIDANERLWTDDRIRNWLFDQFHNKCWYSEAYESVSPTHVDHFRPKGRVKDDLTGVFESGYWWLAFNWKNYRISGHLLNSKKGDLFPIVQGKRGTHDDETSLELEAPVLIDPLSDQARLISFQVDEDGCLAVPAPGCHPSEQRRAERTIEIIGLNLRDRLNKKRKVTWDKAEGHIADFQSAAATVGAQCLAMIQQACAKTELRKMVRYETEFSSIAEACIEKEAPVHLKRMVFDSIS
ncbi:MAG: hypothetical protein V4819_11185 [Verrucomicrobiota bacterium]